jgi:hypothetical protein
MGAWVELVMPEKYNGATAFPQAITMFHGPCIIYKASAGRMDNDDVVVGQNVLALGLHGIASAHNTRH